MTVKYPERLTLICLISQINSRMICLKILDIQLPLLNLIWNQEIPGLDVFGYLPTRHATIIFQKYSWFIFLKLDITLYSVYLGLYGVLYP